MSPNVQPNLHDLELGDGSEEVPVAVQYGRIRYSGNESAELALEVVKVEP